MTTSLRTFLGLASLFWVTGLAACGPGPAGEAGRSTTSASEGHATGMAAALSASCSGCHMAGLDRSADAIPSIEGLDAGTLKASLVAYRADDVGDTVMHRIARGYTEAELDLIADYLAGGER